MKNLIYKILVLVSAVKFVFISRHASSSRDEYERWAAIYEMNYYWRQCGALYSGVFGLVVLELIACG